jgi:hypothetical protein
LPPQRGGAGTKRSAFCFRSFAVNRKTPQWEKDKRFVEARGEASPHKGF